MAIKTDKHLLIKVSLEGVAVLLSCDALADCSLTCVRRPCRFITAAKYGNDENNTAVWLLIKKSVLFSRHNAWILF